LIATTVADAIAGGEMKKVDPDAVASTMIALLEGAVMLAKLHGDPTHMRLAVEHLSSYIDGLSVARTPRSA
jgi:hypothetical protein